MMPDLIRAPDGRQVAFTIKPRPFTGHIIYIFDSKKDKVRKLVEPKKYENYWFPQWSPDRRRIVFEGLKYKSLTPEGKMVDGGLGFWIIDADGTNAKYVCSNIEDNKALDYPKWCPDGKRIIYSVKRIGRKSNFCDLWIMDENGKDRKKFLAKVDSQLAGTSYKWSLDGKWLLFLRKGSLWRIDFSGERKQRLTKDFNIWYFNISPDGKKACFISKEISKSHKKYNLWLINLENLKITPLLPREDVGTASWFQDSRRIVYSTFDQQKCSSQIWVMNINTGEKKLLIQGQYHDTHPISLQDEKILFMRNAKTIWLMNSDGSNQRQIFPKP